MRNFMGCSSFAPRRRWVALSGTPSGRSPLGNLPRAGARPRLVVAAWAEHPQFCFYQSDDYPIDLWAGLDDPTRFRDLSASQPSWTFNSLIVSST